MIQHGKREGHPVELGGCQDDTGRASRSCSRKAAAPGKERRRMPVLADAENDKVEDRKWCSPKKGAKLLLVPQSGLIRPKLALYPVNIFIRYCRLPQ